MIHCCWCVNLLACNRFPLVRASVVRVVNSTTRQGAGPINRAVDREKGGQDGPEPMENTDCWGREQPRWFGRPVVDACALCRAWCGAASADIPPLVHHALTRLTRGLGCVAGGGGGARHLPELRGPPQPRVCDRHAGQEAKNPSTNVVPSASRSAPSQPRCVRQYSRIARASACCSSIAPRET